MFAGFQVWVKNTSGDADSQLQLNLHAWICLRWIFAPCALDYYFLIPIIIFWSQLFFFDPNYFCFDQNYCFDPITLFFLISIYLFFWSLSHLPLIRVYIIPIYLRIPIRGLDRQTPYKVCVCLRWVYRFYRGKSPSNLHLGEYFLHFPSILSKSKKDFDCDCILFSELPFLGCQA